MAEPVVLVGAIGGPFGVKGWMRVKSYTEEPSNLLDYAPWHLRRRERWEAVQVEARAHGDGLIARIEGVGDRETASAWRGAEIGVEASVLPPPDADEFYWRDLVGSEVANRADASLGRLVRLFSTPAHDVMAVADGTGERLIPFVREIVVDVDPTAKRIVVDWDADWN